MATITAIGTYLDNGTARTAGEAMTINSGGQLIVRTDTRVHANAPASMTGYLGAITVNDGECFVDATAVREIAFDTGTGNVPAIGTTVSQGGVSGYLLGVWASRLVAPTAVGAAMPATGFIKFREVSGGAFSAGALTGIGASATGADVPGWLEIVLGAVDITVPRLGKFKTRGDWFYLGNTTGARAQVIQVPTNGGGANTYCPGVWVETASGSGIYEQYPALNGAANGWSVIHLGAAEGYTDDRHKFVKMLSTGQMQFGETVTFASTYGSVAAQASTYADWSVSATYTLTANVCTCYVAAGHGLYGGETVGLDFPSGPADTTGTATVLDAYYFSVPVTNADTSGSVTARFGATVSFTAHGLAEGNQVGLTVSTGTLPTGTYTVHSVAATGTYNVLYAHTAVLTSGSASALHTLTVTRATHGMAVGNEVWLDFTTGGATDGKFVMRSVVAGSYNVNYPHLAAITAGATVTERYEIGKVPASGCKVRVPNIFVRSGTTSENVIPNATLASRPEFITTSAGAIDLEYLYAENLYPRFGQPYSFKCWHSAFMDGVEITELATAIDIDNVQVGHYTGGTASTPLALISSVAGGKISTSKFYRQGTPSSSPVNIQFCYGVTISNCEAGFLQYARATNTAWSFSGGGSVTLNNCKSFNGSVRLSTVLGATVTNHKHFDRLTGVTNTAAVQSAVDVVSSFDVTIDGVTWDENRHPYIGAVALTTCAGVKVRNIGSYAAPVVNSSWEPNVYGIGALLTTGANNKDVAIQRCAVESIRGTTLIGSNNTDVGVLIESCCLFEYFAHATNTVGNRVIVLANNDMDCSVKGLTTTQGLTGQASVYGTHFHDLFMGKTYGQVALCMNEPTTKTSSYFTMVSGVAKFNSAGGILMGVIGDQAVWEMPYFALGHTGFVNETVQMSGGTLADYRFYYQIDTGSGYSALSAQLTGAQLGTALAGETISPSTGFKLKIRITTTTTNTTAITFLRIRTTTTESAQSTNLYPLDTNTITFTGLPTGCDVVVLTAGTSTILDQKDSLPGTTCSFTYSGAQMVDVGFIKPGYIPYYQRNLAITTVDSSLPITLTPDRNYS